ncbi:MAG TPA: glycosyltransferase [Acidimicrobiia bacterium]
MPVALMEAMACGTPVVSTRAGAIAELVESCGILVAPGDPLAFSRALDSLRNDSLRAELGSRGRARVAAEFRSSESGGRVMALARAQTAGAPFARVSRTMVATPSAASRSRSTAAKSGAQ